MNMNNTGLLEKVEKPNLFCSPCAEKLPLVLSSLGSADLVQVPASIAQFLRDYQCDGVRFLYARYKDGEGGILADDMGLGKTIQTIAFLAAILNMSGTSDDMLRHCANFIKQDAAPGIEVPTVTPALIVCPASLCDNWIQELLTWAHFKVLKYCKKTRENVLRRAIRQECDVVVVTLEMARADIHQLSRVRWSVVIVDEVHRIKDPTSQLCKALHLLQCRYRYGLTGTPLQNNLKELWCLLDWANPESLGDLGTFTYNTVRVIEQGQRHNATKRELAEARRARMHLATLRNRYMLRRTKALLRDQLPCKTDQVVFCEPTSLQSEVYRRIIESDEVQALLESWKKCACGSRRSAFKCCQKEECGQKTGVKPGTLFTFMHLLLKAANHLGLLLTSPSSRQNEVAQSICQEAFERCSELRGGSLGDKLKEIPQTELSGKMSVLALLLEKSLTAGDKVLLFSRSTQLLNLIQKFIQLKRYKYYRLDGTTPVELRCDLVHAFNATPEACVFLLSTQAGGVGLNMTGANVVIVYDPNWNPAHDLQAQDRAYRLGQQRDVRVYRLLSTATIEELIYLRQIYKQQLAAVAVSNENARRFFNSVAGDSRFRGELFGVKNIFTFRESSRSVTEEILERQQHVEQGLQLCLQVPQLDELGFNIAPYVLEVPEIDDIYKTPSKQSGFADLASDIEEGVYEDFEIVFEFEIEDEHNDGLVTGQGVEEEDGDDSDGHDCNVGNDDGGGAVRITNHAGMKQNEIPRSTQDIFDACDVTHVVKHHDIIGPSHAENLMVDEAVEDVFEKGVNSQLPACDCTSRILCQPQYRLPESSSLWALRRVIFNKLAKKMSLTPYELGLKVLSMSDDEKVAVLSSRSETNPVVKRKLPTVGTENRDSKQEKRLKNLTTMVLSGDNNGKQDDAQEKKENIVVSEEKNEEGNETEGNDESLTKQSLPMTATELLDSLFFPNESYQTQTAENISNTISITSHKVMASGHGLGKEKGGHNLNSSSRPGHSAASSSSLHIDKILESTFFGDVEIKSSLRRERNASQCASTSRTPASSSHVEQLLNDTFFGNGSFSRSADETYTHKPLGKRDDRFSYNYPIEDDVFEQLLKSGKLKKQ